MLPSWIPPNCPRHSCPSPSRLPWDFHPALTEERLRVCARMLANARRDALAMASYELDDDPWSVSCCAFAFGCHRLPRRLGLLRQYAVEQQIEVWQDRTPNSDNLAL